jgi:hypothetical protein
MDPVKVPAQMNRQSKLKTKLVNINQNGSPEKQRDDLLMMEGLQRNSNIKQKILSKYTKNAPEAEALAHLYAS